MNCLLYDISTCSSDFAASFHSCGPSEDGVVLRPSYFFLNPPLFPGALPAVIGCTHGMM